METNTELWTLLYLVDWEESGKIYPDISAIYPSWEAAEKARKKKIDPSKYWIRRARMDAENM